MCKTQQILIDGGDMVKFYDFSRPAKWRDFLKTNQQDSKEPVTHLCVYSSDFMWLHFHTLTTHTLSCGCMELSDATDSVKRDYNVAAGGDECTNCCVAHVSS